MHELLIWVAIVGIFAAGFVLGANVMLLHAAALTRRMPIPKELLPRDVGAPLPVESPSPPTVSAFAPKTVRQPAKPETKAAFLEELSRRVIESRRKESEAKPEEPDPLPANIVRSVMPPPVQWNPDPPARKTSSRKW